VTSALAFGTVALCGVLNGRTALPGDGAGTTEAGVRFAAAPDIPTALTEAREQKRLLIVYVSSSTCGVCSALERRGFRSPAVSQALAGHLVFHVTAEVPSGVEVQRAYQVDGYPTLIFLSPDGGELDRVEGYSVPEVLIRDVERIRGGIDTIPTLRTRAAAGDDSAARILLEKLVRAAPAEAIERASAGLGRAGAPNTPWLLLQRGRASIRLREFGRAAEDFQRVVQQWPSEKEASTVADAGLLEMRDAPIEVVMPLISNARARLSSREDRRAVEENAILLLRGEIARCMDRRVADAAGDADVIAGVVDDCAALRVRLHDAVRWGRGAVAQKRTPLTLFALAKALACDSEDRDEPIALAREASASLTAQGRASRELENCLLEWTARRDARVNSSGDGPSTERPNSQR